MGGGGEPIQASLFKAWIYNIYAILPPGLTSEIQLDVWMPFFIFVFVSLVILIVLFILYHEPMDRVKSFIPIMMLVLYPYVWYGAITNHSEVHPMFTYRNQIITIMGGWITVSQCIRWSKIREKIYTRVMRWLVVVKGKKDQF